MAVDATQIANLLAIARTGSFTRAAQEKGMSQPALSNSIALLEQRLGVKVLERTRRGSTLTSYGEILVRRAEGLQALLQDAEIEIRRYADGVAGPLRIGGTPSVLTELVPRALAELVKAQGPVDIEIIEGLDQALVPRLRSGEIDVIVGPVGEMFMDSPDISEKRLMSDPFAIGVGPFSSFHARDAIMLGELADAPWIVPRPGSTYRRHVEALFMNAGVPWPRDCIVANSIPLLEALVRGSDRVTIVSPVQISKRGKGFKVLPLAGGAARSIGYKIRSKGRVSPLGQAFLDELEAAAGIGASAS